MPVLLDSLCNTQKGEIKSGVLVIGCGNLLVADDAIGLHVLRSLKKLQLPAGVKLVEAGTPGLDLLYIWEGYSNVIIVDAVKSGEPPGTIHILSQEDLLEKNQLPLTSHDFDIIDALNLGRALGQVPNNLVIVGIEIACDEHFFEGLSPDVAEAIPAACDCIVSEIKKRLK